MEDIINSYLLMQNVLRHIVQHISLLVIDNHFNIEYSLLHSHKLSNLHHYLPSISNRFRNH